MADFVFPSLGLYWFADVDPTIGSGVSAPFGQLLIRTDITGIYYKSGPADTDWNSVALGATAIANFANFAGIYGDGFDGICNFDGIATVLGLVPSGGIYTLTRDIFPSSMVLSANVGINEAGFRIFCLNQCTMAVGAWIGAPGNNGIVSAGGLGTATGLLFGGSAGGRGWTGTLNAAAGVGSAIGTLGRTSATSSALGSAIAGTAGLPGNVFLRGGGGGAGTNATLATRTSGNGGTIGVAVASQGFGPPGIYAGRTANNQTVLTAGAGGGGGGGGVTTLTDFGGGGGGGGGNVFLASRIINAPLASIRTNGGNGADGTGPGSGGGAGGGGGNAILFYNRFVGAFPTVNITGGNGGVAGSGGGNGGNGANGLLFDYRGFQT